MIKLARDDFAKKQLLARVKMTLLEFDEFSGNLADVYRVGDAQAIVRRRENVEHIRIAPRRHVC